VYIGKLPEKYPDLKTNCEDIVMAFIYAHYSRTPPLHINAPFVDGADMVGIAGMPGHYEARTECVRHITELYGPDTLILSSVVLSRMR
jgi:hypothetical protein